MLKFFFLHQKQIMVPNYMIGHQKMMLRNCTETINSMDQSKDHGVYVESTRELLLYKRENSNLLWTSTFYANYMHSIQNIRVYFKINSIWHPGLINMGKEHVYVYISEWVYWLQVQRFWYPKFCFTSFTSPRDRYFPSKASITTNFYESITIKMQFPHSYHYSVNMNFQRQEGNARFHIYIALDMAKIMKLF